MTHSPLRWTSPAAHDAHRHADGDAPTVGPSSGPESSSSHDGPVVPRDEDAGHVHPHEAGPPAAEPATGASDVTRRTFLAAAGFSLAGALAACNRAPAQSAVPGSTQPEETIAGVSTWYATTCGGCAAGCGLIVRLRYGRPVKVGGNPDHPCSPGRLCARCQASGARPHTW